MSTNFTPVFDYTANHASCHPAHHHPLQVRDIVDHIVHDVVNRTTREATNQIVRDAVTNLVHDIVDSICDSIIPHHITALLERELMANSIQSQSCIRPLYSYRQQEYASHACDDAHHYLHMHFPQCNQSVVGLSANNYNTLQFSGQVPQNITVQSPISMHLGQGVVGATEFLGNLSKPYNPGDVQDVGGATGPIAYGNGASGGTRHEEPHSHPYGTEHLSLDVIEDGLYGQHNIQQQSPGCLQEKTDKTEGPLYRD